MDIEGKQGQWDDGLDAINSAILAKAKAIDVTKNELVTKFKEFNITKLVR